jgi:hypothetical protein
MERVKTETSTSGRVSPASEVASENADAHHVENADEKWVYFIKLVFMLTFLCL